MKLESELINKTRAWDKIGTLTMTSTVNQSINQTKLYFASNLQTAKYANISEGNKINCKIKTKKIHVIGKFSKSANDFINR